ncbi:MAG: hypothetical protein H7A41_06965 [Chlamydiales bacterium]|nr:hypothetical protein [Chlamydiales bacterium]
MTTSTPTLRVHFCGDSQTPVKQLFKCASLLSEIFGEGQVFVSNPSPFISSGKKRITTATTLLAKSILDHQKEKGRYSQRFILFTYGEGIKVVKLTLKKLSEHNIDIHVYTFGNTLTLISNQLARKVQHSIFPSHLSPRCSILSKMFSIHSKMEVEKMSYEVAVLVITTEDEQETPQSLNGDDFFDSEFKRRMKKYEELFKSYSINFVDPSSVASPKIKKQCEFLSYPQVIQEIAQTECNPEN